MPLDELSTVIRSGSLICPSSSLRTSLLETVRLALPMIVSRAGLATMGIADAVMVSRFSPSEFAALSLADGTLGRIADVFAAFVIAGLVLVPRAFGAGDLAESVHVWRRSILPAVGLGLVGALLGFSGVHIFHLLGQNAYLSAQAGSLTPILGLGYVAALLALGAAVFLEGVRRPNIVAASVVGANILNIFLNWLLIAGHAGRPALGARGSAISTTVVRLALAIILVTYAARIRFNDSSRAPQKSQAMLQHKLGLSASVVQGLMLMLTASLLVFAGWMGPLALAVLSAVWNLNAPAMLIALGVADATGIRIASADGQRSGSAANGILSQPPRAILFTGLTIIVSVLAVVVAAWALFSRGLAEIFTNDRLMLQGLVSLIPIAGVLLLLDGVSFLTVSALRALRDIMLPTSIEIGTMAALVPLAAWLAFGMKQGVRGLVVAATISAAARVVLLTWRFAWLTKSTESIS